MSASQRSVRLQDNSRRRFRCLRILRPRSAVLAIVAAGIVSVLAKPAAAQSIDDCLIGTWVATNVTTLRTAGTGGEGFRVTFEADGTQTIDYSATKYWKSRDLSAQILVRGTARGRIATDGKTARLLRVEKSDVTRTITWKDIATKDVPHANLGPGGLGNTANDNGYTCSATALEYKTSVADDRSPTHLVRFALVGKRGRGVAGRYPEEGP